MERPAMDEQLITSGGIDCDAMNAEEASRNVNDAALFALIELSGEEESGDAEGKSDGPAGKEIADQGGARRRTSASFHFGAFPSLRGFGRRISGERGALITGRREGGKNICII
jgi:hypothetical protein